MADTGNSDTPELWTTGQAAAYLERWGITRRMVSNLVNAGELGVRRGPGKYAKIPRGAVEAYGEALDQQAAQRRQRAAEQRKSRNST